MPKVRAGEHTLNYEQQGSGEPMVLIPYLAADHACYAFQVAEYSKRFTCISVDLRGTGDSDKPPGAYSIEALADDVAALMQALDVQRAHIFGLSLGAATGIWLAVKYPDLVKTLSVHSGWTKTDSYIATVVESWQVLSRALASVQEMTIQGIFPWCFTPELYVHRPDYILELCDFVRSRPKQPIEAFILQSNAVLQHDVEEHLGRVRVPTQITFGHHDMLTSTRFARAFKNSIKRSEIHIFEDCSHAPIYENVPAFNEVSLAFLSKHAS